MRWWHTSSHCGLLPLVLWLVLCSISPADASCPNTTRINRTDIDVTNLSDLDVVIEQHWHAEGRVEVTLTGTAGFGFGSVRVMTESSEGCPVTISAAALKFGSLELPNALPPFSRIVLNGAMGLNVMVRPMSVNDTLGFGLSLGAAFDALMPSITVEDCVIMGNFTLETPFTAAQTTVGGTAASIGWELSVSHSLVAGNVTVGPSEFGASAARLNLTIGHSVFDSGLSVIDTIGPNSTVRLNNLSTASIDVVTPQFVDGFDLDNLPLMTSSTPNFALHATALTVGGDVRVWVGHVAVLPIDIDVAGSRAAGSVVLDANVTDNSTLAQLKFDGTIAALSVRDTTVLGGIFVRDGLACSARVALLRANTTRVSVASPDWFERWTDPTQVSIIESNISFSAHVPSWDEAEVAVVNQPRGSSTSAVTVDDPCRSGGDTVPALVVSGSRITTALTVQFCDAGDPFCAKPPSVPGSTRFFNVYGVAVANVDPSGVSSARAPVAAVDVSASWIDVSLWQTGNLSVVHQLDVTVAAIAIGTAEVPTTTNSSAEPSVSLPPAPASSWGPIGTNNTNSGAGNPFLTVRCGVAITVQVATLDATSTRRAVGVYLPLYQHWVAGDWLARLLFTPTSCASSAAGVGNGTLSAANTSTPAISKFVVVGGDATAGVTLAVQPALIFAPFLRSSRAVWTSASSVLPAIELRQPSSYRCLASLIACICPVNVTVQIQVPNATLTLPMNVFGILALASSEPPDCTRLGVNVSASDTAFRQAALPQPQLATSTTYTQPRQGHCPALFACDRNASLLGTTGASVPLSVFTVVNCSVSEVHLIRASLSPPPSNVTLSHTKVTLLRSFLIDVGLMPDPVALNILAEFSQFTLGGLLLGDKSCTATRLTMFDVAVRGAATLVRGCVALTAYGNAMHVSLEAVDATEGMFGSGALLPVTLQLSGDGPLFVSGQYATSGRSGGYRLMIIASTVRQGTKPIIRADGTAATGQSLFLFDSASDDLDISLSGVILDGPTLTVVDSARGECLHSIVPTLRIFDSTVSVLRASSVTDNVRGCGTYYFTRNQIQMVAVGMVATNGGRPIVNFIRNTIFSATREFSGQPVVPSASPRLISGAYLGWFVCNTIDGSPLASDLPCTSCRVNDECIPTFTIRAMSAPRSRECHCDCDMKKVTALFGREYIVQDSNCAAGYSPVSWTREPTWTRMASRTRSFGSPTVSRTRSRSGFTRSTTATRATPTFSVTRSHGSASVSSDETATETSSVSVSTSGGTASATDSYPSPTADETPSDTSTQSVSVADSSTATLWFITDSLSLSRSLYVAAIPPRSRDQVMADVFATVLPGPFATVAMDSVRGVAGVGALGSPTSATKAANLMNLVSNTDCGFNSEDLNPPPAAVIAPWSLDDSNAFGYVLGPIVSLSIATTVGQVGNFFLHSQATKSVGLRQFWSALGSFMLGYFLPTTAGLSTTALNHSSEALSVFVAVCGFAVAFGLIGGLSGFMLKRVKPLKRLAATNTYVMPEPQQRGYIVLAHLDAARVPNDSACRLFVFEDLLIAVLLGVISGVRPDSGDCALTATMALVVTLLHVLYIALFRPLKSPVEALLVTALAVVQAALAAAVLAAAVNQQKSSDWISYTAVFMALLTLLQAVYACVDGARTRIEGMRKGKRPPAADQKTDGQQTVGEGGEEGPGPRTNPLDALDPLETLRAFQVAVLDEEADLGRRTRTHRPPPPPPPPDDLSDDFDEVRFPLRQEGSALRGARREPTPNSSGAEEDDYHHHYRTVEAGGIEWSPTRRARPASIDVANGASLLAAIAASAAAERTAARHHSQSGESSEPRLFVPEAQTSHVRRPLARVQRASPLDEAAVTRVAVMTSGLRDRLITEATVLGDAASGQLEPMIGAAPVPPPKKVRRVPRPYRTDMFDDL
jgi:hypothetical protein